MKPQLVPVILGGRRGVRPFDPIDLFTSGVQGAWYDPSDYSTLFQDSAGTTPVTAVEQPVGLMLDKSQGLAIGPELVTNGDFSNGTTGWSSAAATISVDADRLKVTLTAAAGRAFQTITTVVGRAYRITFSVTNGDATNCLMFVGIGNDQNAENYNSGFVANGTYTAYFFATATTTYVKPVITGSSGKFAYFDNISVKELPGNHASQATAASRPVLRARYNLLTYSEQFDNAAWVKSSATVTQNAATAPDGAMTADLIYPSSSGASRGAYQTINQANTVSIYAKAAGKQFIALIDLSGGAFAAWFDLINGTTGNVTAGYTATITSVGSGWYRCSLRANSNGSFTYHQFGIVDSSGSASVTANGTDGVYVWGAQVADTRSFPSNTYQRIAASTDYATAGFLPYLAFDGTDDNFGTNSINFTATDKMSVCAGVTKLSDAAIGMPVEFSADASSNNGSFQIQTSANTYGFALRGTGVGLLSATTFTAPVTNVLSSSMDIAQATIATELLPRINGAIPTLATTLPGPAGTGNFGNYPLFIGRRNNSTYPFNGRIYGLIVAGKTLSASELSATESWMAAKTGVTL